MNHNLRIIPIPAFKDNYIWLIHNGIEAAIVDPGDSAPAISVLTQLNLNLTAIMITHHHHDHIDGVAELLKAYPAAKAYAPALERYAFEHIAVAEPSSIDLKGLNITFSVLDLPGHTLGHIAYYASQQQLLFCGDTLFGAGCGRLFEGTPTQMYTSLQKLAALPSITKVYCTHEYTMNNIHFALEYESDNQRLVQRLNDTKKLRLLDIPSLPSSIELELATNPFLRCNSKEIQSSMQLSKATEIDTFTKLREIRNLY